MTKNIKFARNICKKILLKDLPIAPHLYFTQFMDDNIISERNKAFKLNYEILKNCDYLLVCKNEISDGMKCEIEFANKNGIEVKYL